MILDLCAVTCTIAFVFMTLVVVTDAFGVRKELERIADALENKPKVFVPARGNGKSTMSYETIMNMKDGE